MSNEVKPEYIVPMLDKSMQVLDFLFQKPGFASIVEISKSLNIAKGSVFRILYTLQQYHFVRKNDEDQYSIGPAFLYYGTRLKKDWDLLSLARSILQDAVDETGETANLGIFLDNQVVNLDSISGEEFFIVKNLIPVSPLYCSSMGKIFLSEMSEEDFATYVARTELKPRTVSTITDPELLAQEVRLVKERGLSQDKEEYTYGLSCFGKGIYRDGKIIAAVSLSGPTSRLAHKGEYRIKDSLEKLAKRIQDLPYSVYNIE